MKFERLSKSELENLKDDFVRFLATQGIDAPMWQELKENNLEKAEGIIDVYSDLVYEQALSKCQYLEHISAKEFKCIRFTPTQAVLIGVKVSANSEANLNAENFATVVEKGVLDGSISVFTASKKHVSTRELEMFSWIKKGAYMANGDWYNQLIKLL